MKLSSLLYNTVLTHASGVIFLLLSKLDLKFPTFQHPWTVSFPY